MKEDESDGNKDKSRPYQEKEERMKLWGILIFGLIGATATTFAVGQLRRTVDFVYAQEFDMRYGSGWQCVERIRRMQSVFNRERNKYKRSYESWRENGQGTYDQHFQRDDWYWKSDTTYKDRKTNFRETPRGSSSYLLSHHYAVLGLNRSRTEPYSESEIKKAFRTKAKEFHPDQNQDNKEAAEAKFKEVMTSYEAIKEERKGMKA